MSVLDVLPEAPVMVQNCPYLVRKGQAPDYVGRSNIIPWNAPLAARPHEWAPLFDEANRLVTQLPPLGLAPARTQPVAPLPNTPPIVVHLQQPSALAPAEAAPAADEVSTGAAPDADAMRTIQIMTAFESLSEDQMKGDGTPNVNAMRQLTGFSDLTVAEVLPLWEEYKNPKP